MISMNIIYLDTLFLVNFICDYILLLCTARAGGAVIKRIPMLFSAVLGGLYACISCLSVLIWIRHPLIKCAVSILMCIISFGRETHLLQCSLIFLCISALTGGLLSAISIPYNGMQYLPINFKTILLAFSAIYFLLSIFFRSIPQMQRREYQQVTVFLNDKSVSFRALRDSGNELYDPISNAPVLICCPKVLNPLFSEVPNWQADPYELLCQMNAKEECENRMRLIPCHSVTGSGLLPGFRPDRVLIAGQSQPHIIAVSTGSFTPDVPYQAIY